MDIIFFSRWKKISLDIVSWIVVMEILYCEIVGNDFFLDIVSWIVVDCAVEHKNNLQLFIRRNGAHGNRVSTNCAGFDLAEKKKNEKKNPMENSAIWHTNCEKIIFLNWEQLRSLHK